MTGATLQLPRVWRPGIAGVPMAGDPILDLVVRTSEGRNGTG